MTDIHITANEQMIVQRILQSLLPETAKGWVFSSRVTGKVRAASDLDLAVDAGRALTLHEVGLLADAFDEAPLSYKLDVVDVQTVSTAFRAIVERDRVAWEKVVGYAPRGANPPYGSKLN